MWQLQWAASLLPDAVLNWIYWGIIAVGITGVFAGWLGRFIPFYGKYVRFLKPIGIVLLVLGVWLRGGYDTEMSWRSKVEELEAKVKKSEQRSNDANVKIETVYKDRIKVVKDQQTIIQEKIKEVEKIIDAECKVDKEAIEILNSSARQPQGVKK